ncbi:MAG: 2OG-Fe(II) oxygenase [Pseudomonadota bacterium]
MTASTSTKGAAPSADALRAHVLASLEARETHEAPYAYAVLRDMLPNDAIEAIYQVPADVPDVAGESGRREIHNKSRSYFDVETQRDQPVAAALCEAFQAPETVSAIERAFGTDLEGTSLRVEYALDTDGFWLEPHTDLGVKRFTLLIYLSDGEGHEGLGTDIYDGDATPVARSPFGPGTAMAFVPGDDTYHGFEKRPIQGVRRSLIVNYVTPEWRAREQLAYPETPVTAR